MGAFKRHIDPEHCVHNKCMFDYEKFLSNSKIILAIIDAIKLCDRLEIVSRGHRDASKYHPDIGYASASAGVGSFSMFLIMLLEMIIKF